MHRSGAHSCSPLLPSPAVGPAFQRTVELHWVLQCFIFQVTNTNTDQKRGLQNYKHLRAHWAPEHLEVCTWCREAPGQTKEDTRSRDSPSLTSTKIEMRICSINLRGLSVGWNKRVYTWKSHEKCNMKSTIQNKRKFSLGASRKGVSGEGITCCTRGGCSAEA